MGRPKGTANAQTESDAYLYWTFVKVNRPTKDEVTSGLGFSPVKATRLRKFLARETGQDIVIPPSKPDAATGRWEYHISYDSERSAEWVAWSLRHISARAGWISEVTDRLAAQFPKQVLFSVIQATATALQKQADAARNTLEDADLNGGGAPQGA